MKYFIAAVCSGIFLAVATAGAEPAALVVAVRGKATVERGIKKLDAQPRLGIELHDTVSTSDGGRVKLLFVDDSVLTLAEKTRMSVDTFIHSRDDRGKSLFSLLGGKMRAVSGRTRFEVKTPTVVATARGTIIFIETGTLNGRIFTRVNCLEGIVNVRALSDVEEKKSATLSPGESLLVFDGQPLPLPAKLTAEEIENLKRDTSTSGAEIRLPGVPPRESIFKDTGITPIPVVPSFDLQQPVQPRNP